MKILLVNNYATPRDGASIVSLWFREELRRRGHDARLFASSAGVEGGECHADYLCYGTHSRLQTLLQPANPSAFRQLRRALADFQPDVVHVRAFLWQLSPLILPILRNFPTLYSAVSYKSICPVGTKMLPDGHICNSPPGVVCHRQGCLTVKTWIPMMIQQKLWNRWNNVFDLNVATSEAARRRLKGGGLNISHVIPEAIAFRPPRQRLSSPPTVVYAGRLVREKGVDTLLRAFDIVAQAFSGAELLIAGDGPARKYLMELVTGGHSASRVRFLGHLPQAELERCFEKAWVQVVPSRWEEPFGLVAAEAMMRGTAVVASAVGALSDIIEDGKTGLLVPPGDSRALAGAMIRLLRDIELAENMGRSGRASAQVRFGRDTQVQAFIGLYEKLIDERNRSGPMTRS